MTQPEVWLVTGGAGFIGSHLVKALLTRGNRVRVVDDFSTGIRNRLTPFGDDLELIEGSITSPEVCRRACKQVRYILHQAALPSVQRSLSDPLATHEVAATGTVNLLVAARNSGVTRIVYAGSSSAYGNTLELPKRESMPTNPRSPYAVSKLAGELYVRSFSELFGVEGVVLRYFNIFGPGQDPKSEYAAVIPRFVAAALTSKAPSIHGDGQQSRDFTFVDNAVSANLKAVAAPASLVAGKVFNVGSGTRISVNDLWREVARATNATVAPRYDDPRPGDVRDSLASLDESRRCLGYEPIVSFRDGLLRTVDAIQRTGPAEWVPSEEP